MKKNGFTLLELMGVIVLLGLIAIIAFPPVIKQIKGSKSTIDKAQKDLIIMSASNYIDENKNSFPIINNNVYCISLKELVEDNKLSADLKDSNGDKINLDKYVSAKVVDNSFIYNITNECTRLVFNPNLSSESNCIMELNSVCPNGTKVNVKVNENEDYDFYVIADKENELTLIMDRNLGGYVLWISKTDYEAAGGTDFGTTGNNEKGPLTALKALEDRTRDWTNVEEYNYTLADDGGGNKYQPLERINVRARMLKYTEAKNLGCTSTSSICSSFLFENLSDSNTEEVPVGYWTSSAYSTSSKSWYIYYLRYAYPTGVYKTGSVGIRPVIKMKKFL